MSDRGMEEFLDTLENEARERGSIIHHKLCSECGGNKPYGQYILKKDGTRTIRCTDCIIKDQSDRWADLKILGVFE